MVESVGFLYSRFELSWGGRNGAVLCVGIVPVFRVRAEQALISSSESAADQFRSYQILGFYIHALTPIFGATPGGPFC